MPIFDSEYPTNSSPADGDYILTTDTSDGKAVKRVTFSALKNYLIAATKWITRAMIGDGEVPVLRDTRYYTASNTWTKPTGMTANGFIKVTVVGGGGAGAGAPTTTSGQRSLGNGGVSGVNAQSVIPASSLASSVAVTVGAAGIGALGTDGGSGGQSSFGTLVVAPGGVGGVAAAFTATALVFSPSLAVFGGVGDILIPGRPGAPAFAMADASNSGKGGDGGFSNFGTAAIGARTNSAIIENASGYGAGGGGMSNSSSRSASTGSNGSPGLIIVEEYY